MTEQRTINIFTTDYKYLSFQEITW